MIKELSDISRTNQIKIDESENVAEKLFQYLFRVGKGIAHFEYKPSDDFQRKDSNSKDEFYKKRHQDIKRKVKERLLEYGETPTNSEDIQYFLSYIEKKTYVFFLYPTSSEKINSGWKQLFDDIRSRERIFNLVFKFYLLSRNFLPETMNGFEELLLIHSKKQTKDKKALIVWGQNLLIKYNKHNVLTLTLSRKRRCLKQNKNSKSKIKDDLELGELLIYNNKNYYFERDLDARQKNDIAFMKFPKEETDFEFEVFKKTQLYHYQNLITQLELFLTECGIGFKSLSFQANHYLSDRFVKDNQIETLETLEIINNTGFDFTEDKQQFLENLLKHEGISSVTFYNSGKTISTYERLSEEEDNIYWKITEVVLWSNIELDQKTNYLVFNKTLKEETGSMGYRGENDLWYPSDNFKAKSKVDFYSQLKKKYNYLDKKEFFSLQGMNLSELKPVGKSNTKSVSILNINKNKKIDRDSLREYTRDILGDDFFKLDNNEAIISYLKAEQDTEKWKSFCKKYNIKVSSEFQKVLIELGIKNWIRKSLTESTKVGLQITPQSFSKKQFFAIYVRSPKKEEAKVVAVEFRYENDRVFIQNVISDQKEIRKRFPFLKLRKNSESLLNNQQYFVDELEKVCISCYTDDHFTPTLIGRNGILEQMENKTLKINRTTQGKDSSKLLPLATYYNAQINSSERRDMICLDLQNETFIQYFIPPAQSIPRSIKRGLRVYHLLGKIYGENEKTLSTSELIETPIAALHFSTLTQNLLKISENSQSSLLQKVARVFIEN